MTTPSSPTSAPALVAAGEIVMERYRVERLLGTGAMGVVVAARHITLDRVVAIKLVADRFGSREEAIARFLTEARAAARIESDHVCQVFDVGQTASGVPFMVMEHLEGNDLDDELHRRGELAVFEAVDYVLQAADAIAAAHRLGIVHRDLKPANLFLAKRPDGSRRVKVLDFGISRSYADPMESQATRATSLGTPAFMSPEQVRGEDVDGRADIWALGAILYELLTGQMAFVGDDVRAVLDMVLSDAPCPIERLRHDVPRELEAVVAKCLARDRNERFASAGALAIALAPFASPGLLPNLTNLGREVGTIAPYRHHAAPSVTPIVASVRPEVATLPDPEEVRSREEIVRAHSKDRARMRVVRAVSACALGLAIFGTLGVVAFQRVRARAFHVEATAVDLMPDTPPPQALSAIPSAPPSASVEPAPLVSAAPRDVDHLRRESAHPVDRPISKPGKTNPASKATVNRLLESRD